MGLQDRNLQTSHPEGEETDEIQVTIHVSRSIIIYKRKDVESESRMTGIQSDEAAGGKERGTSV